MPPSPIYNADELVQDAVAQAIQSINPAPRFYWETDGVNRPKPYIRGQLQSDISTAHKVGRGGATGLVSVFAVDNARDAARDSANSIAPAVEAATIPGYSVSFEYVRKVRPYFDGLAYNAGHVFRFTLTQPL